MTRITHHSDQSAVQSHVFIADCRSSFMEQLCVGALSVLNMTRGLVNQSYEEPASSFSVFVWT